MFIFGSYVERLTWNLIFEALTRW